MILKINLNFWKFENFESFENYENFKTFEIFENLKFFENFENLVNFEKFYNFENFKNFENFENSENLKKIYFLFFFNWDVSTFNILIICRILNKVRRGKEIDFLQAPVHWWKNINSQPESSPALVGK